MMCRGFLIGGTAGRTTLNGEGLQHQDGHSQILASTYPNLKSYDPAFGYELAVIIRDGIRRMYQLQENIFYYITTYNENYLMPVMPDQETTPDLETAITKGAYLYNTLDCDNKDDTQEINLLGSGSIMQQVLGAAEKLNTFGFTVNIWSVTSYTELCRNGEMCDRWNRFHPFEKPKQSTINNLFVNQPGIFVAVTDYMKSLANSIAPWMPSNYTVLGTDGYGLSESRKDLRDFFEVSCDFIVHASLVSLYHADVINKRKLQSLLNQVDLNLEKPNPVER